jgi:hypothetical protein
MKQKKSQITTKNFICEFCGHQVAKEATLIRHYDNCQKKMRFEIRNTNEVQTAFKLWLSIQNNTRPIDDFEKSNLYKTFIDFVMDSKDKGFDHIEQYGQWLLSNKISVYHWKKQSFYNQFLTSFISSENPRDAVIRSLTYIEDIGYLGRFFTTCPVGRILTMIETGKISPWLIFLTDSGHFIARLKGEKLEYFFKLINISVWELKEKRFQKTCTKIRNDLSGVTI